MESRLKLTRNQILAFRRRVGALDERMPMGPESLRRAAWAGLQDSMPRAALLSLHARVDGVEEWKWVKPPSGGTAVWSHDGGICTGEVYKNVVKLTFFKGASLEDPSGLFNSSLEGKVRRAIDVHEDDSLDEEAFKALVRAAAALNMN